jgi:hypothetical protein
MRKTLHSTSSCEAALIRISGSLFYSSILAVSLIACIIRHSIESILAAAVHQSRVEYRLTAAIL